MQIERSSGTAIAPPKPLSSAPRIASALAARSPDVQDLSKRGRSEARAASPRTRARPRNVNGRLIDIGEDRQDEKRAERLEALDAIQLLHQR